MRNQIDSSGLVPKTKISVLRLGFKIGTAAYRNDDQLGVQLTNFPCTVLACLPAGKPCSRLRLADRPKTRRTGIYTRTRI